ncbi:MAG: rhodanese-like domain-containing protein, partial [Planctomycetota bacterium]
MVAEDAHLHSRWRSVLTRNADGAPQVPPLFVAEQGPAVQIVDVRSRGEATGALGYIPGSAFVSEQQTEDFARNDAEAPLVLVCADGEESAAIARRLEGRGANRVAAMAGGIAAWRTVGLSTSRAPADLRDTIERATNAGSAPLTLERVREHVGDPRSVHWIKVTSMIAQGSRSCIDGRDDRAVVGTPGGDGGEFLLLLGAIERVTGRSLDEQTVERELLAHLDLYGHF